MVVRFLFVTYGAENPTIRLTFGKRLRFLALFRATHFLSLRAEIRGPRGILCTRGEKEYASIRLAIVACDDCLVKNEAYDAWQSPGRDTL